MDEHLSDTARSALMSRVRTSGSAPERAVRSVIWRDGFRYRLNVKQLPGKPDLVFPRYRLAVFVNGCFWHNHSCRKGKRPATNREFWDPKLDRNVARDAANRRKLRNAGWGVYTIWECRLDGDTQRVLNRLRNLRDAES